MNRGIRVLQTLALPLGYVANGAGDEARTRYLHLGKVALYQMSYARGTKQTIPDSHEFVKSLFFLFGKNLLQIGKSCDTLNCLNFKKRSLSCCL